MTFNGTLIGDMATYTCDSGFELIGDANTTCTLVDMDSAEFQLAPPSCRREYTLRLRNSLEFSVACAVSCILY